MFSFPFQLVCRKPISNTHAGFLNILIWEFEWLTLSKFLVYSRTLKTHNTAFSWICYEKSTLSVDSLCRGHTWLESDFSLKYQSDVVILVTSHWSSQYPKTLLINVLRFPLEFAQSICLL